MPVFEKFVRQWSVILGLPKSKIFYQVIHWCQRKKLILRVKYSNFNPSLLFSQSVLPGTCIPLRRVCIVPHGPEGTYNYRYQQWRRSNLHLLVLLVSTFTVFCCGCPDCDNRGLAYLYVHPSPAIRLTCWFESDLLTTLVRSPNPRKINCHEMLILFQKIDFKSTCLIRESIFLNDL